MYIVQDTLSRYRMVCAFFAARGSVGVTMIMVLCGFTIEPIHQDRGSLQPQPGRGLRSAHLRLVWLGR